MPDASAPNLPPPDAPTLEGAPAPGCATIAALLALSRCASRRPALASSAPAAAATLLIEGAGDGHGVGMSQDGALGYAEHGWSYAAILAHYYTGTTLGAAPAKTIVRVLVGGRVAEAAARALRARRRRRRDARELARSPRSRRRRSRAAPTRSTAHAGGSRFDVYSDTRSQVYRGTAAETAPHERRRRGDRRADRALRGQAGDHLLLRELRRHDREHRERVPRLGARAVAARRARPLRNRTILALAASSISFAAAAARLRGLVKGSFRGIEVLRRGVSPRIVSALVLGSRGDDARQRPRTRRRASDWTARGPTSACAGAHRQGASPTTAGYAAAGDPAADESGPRRPAPIEPGGGTQAPRRTERRRRGAG